MNAEKLPFKSCKFCPESPEGLQRLQCWSEPIEINPDTLSAECGTGPYVTEKYIDTFEDPKGGAPFEECEIKFGCPRRQPAVPLYTEETHHPDRDELLSPAPHVRHYGSQIVHALIQPFPYISMSMSTLPERRIILTSCHK